MSIKRFLAHIIWMVILVAGVLACQNAREKRLSISNEKTYELITTYRGTRFNNGLPECLEPIRYASRKDTIFKTDKHAVIMVESLRNEYGYRSFVLRNENYSFAWTLVQDDKDKYFIYNDNSLKAYLIDAIETDSQNWRILHRGPPFQGDFSQLKIYIK